MIKNNLLGQILIGFLVVFLLISSVQMFGWGLGIDKVELTEEGAIKIPTLPKGVQDASIDSEDDKKKMMGYISERPMFSDTRKPFEPPIEVVDPNDPENLPPTVDIKAQLTGVVITPEQSYAMILDTLTNQRVTYEVGMPLEGEQGGWTLNSIQSRKVTFVSDDEKTAELELEVFSGALKAGSSKNKRANNQKAQSNNANKKLTKQDKKKNADDIRKKIAERRAQMRAEAAKKNK